MAIGLIAKITVQQGKNEEFEREFLALAEQVRAKEPGNAFYILHRNPAEPQVYTIMEQYKTAEDLEAHSKSDHFREANKALATLVAAAPEIEVLETV